MYFVDRQKIEAVLQYIEYSTSVFYDHHTWETAVERFAIERLAHVLIESVIDVGQQMIDGFIMRDPGSYEDIVAVLDDETVISAEHAALLKTFIAMRKTLVRDFIDVDDSALQTLLQESMPALQQFPTDVRTYLQNELGPVSAFLPEDE